MRRAVEEAKRCRCRGRIGHDSEGSIIDDALTPSYSVKSNPSKPSLMPWSRSPRPRLPRPRQGRIFRVGVEEPPGEDPRTIKVEEEPPEEATPQPTPRAQTTRPVRTASPMGKGTPPRTTSAANAQHRGESEKLVWLLAYSLLLGPSRGTTCPRRNPVGVLL